MRRLSLDWLSAREVEPRRLPALAAANRIDLITVPLLSNLGLRDWHLFGDVEAQKRLAESCQAAGVAIDSVEPFMLGAAINTDMISEALKACVRLGTKRVGILTPGVTLEQAVRVVRSFCRIAAEFRLDVNLEFTPRMPQRNLAEGLAFVRAVACENLALCVDALHFFRSGSSLELLGTLEHGMVGRVQLCDGPETTPASGGADEALNQRMLPGEGEFPLDRFLDALPADIVIGLEVPLGSIERSGVTAAERVKRIVDAARALTEPQKDR
jgi:sugar phosphate isomerase/epimerase